MFATLEFSVVAIVCLITAVVIQRIYYKEIRANGRSEEINGIKWFGLAIFIWGLGALFNLLMVSGLRWPITAKTIVYLGVVVSLLNSLFILLSLPSIKHNTKRNIIVRLVEHFSQREFIMIYAGIMLMLAFVFLASSQIGEVSSNSLIWLIDIPISIVVAFALLNELNKAFSGRKMRFMYLPSFALFVLILIAVTHRIIPSEMIPVNISNASWALLGTVTAISFKFLFILLFSILLYSWKFLSEKEHQQSQLENSNRQKAILERENTQLKIANESHLDTISRLKEELEQLQLASKIVLSERQKEVLANLGRWGESNSYTEIAEAMHISVDGFQAHIHQIKKTLNISGAAGKHQLIKYARENDLLKYTSIALDK